MTTEEIAGILKAEFANKIAGTRFAGARPRVCVRAEAWHEVAMFLRDDPRMAFNLLRCISAIDMLEDKKLIACYDLMAMRGVPNGDKLWTKVQELAIDVEVSRDDPHIPSVADVWPAADWHEREAYDLMGIVFDNHPDSVDEPEGRHPRRILCPDDWAGHPLRKDYVFPMEYHGIPAVTEYEQTRPMH